MALKLDGHAVLRAMLAEPDAFPIVQAELGKIAHTLTVKQVKAPRLDVAGLRRVRDALGPDAFALVVDGLKESELKTVVGRLDRHHPDMKTASGAERRRHLLSLGADLDPAPKPAKASTARSAAARKPTAPKAPRAGVEPAGALDSAAMSAVPPRRRARSAE